MDMQLVIPMEETSSGANNSDHCAEQHQQLDPGFGSTRASDSLERIPSHDAVLSVDLRDQFEVMKSVWRQARRGDDNDDDDLSPGRQGTANEELKRKERQTAVETAIKVEKEITSWKNSIANLEALLAAEEAHEANEEASNDAEHPGIREIAFVRHSRNGQGRGLRPQLQFPYLPPAIPTEDESDESDTQVASSCTSYSSSIK